MGKLRPLALRVLLAGIALFGCQRAVSGPAPGSVPERLVIHGTNDAPAPRPASTYTTTPGVGGALGGAIADDLANRVRAHFRETPLVSDGRLAELSVRVVRMAQARQEVPDAVEIDALARELGLVGPCPFVLLVPYVNGRWPELGNLLATIPGNIRFTHLGVAAVDLPGAVQGAIAVGAQHLTLMPFPRRASVNEKLSFSGTIDRDYRDPRWVWTLPDGSTRPLRSGGGSSISLTTEALAQGVHRFELFGVGPAGLEVLANFPIDVGAVKTLPIGSEPSVDEADPFAALLELINRERAQAGLKLLVRNAALDRIAQAHSTDMVENHFVGHQSPVTGGPLDRVQESGVRLAFFGENVALATSPSVAHRMLMNSPGHRRNILDSRFTHVGIGVAARPDLRPPSISVTEVFGRF